MMIKNSTVGKDVQWIQRKGRRREKGPEGMDKVGWNRLTSLHNFVSFNDLNGEDEQRG